MTLPRSYFLYSSSLFFVFFRISVRIVREVVQPRIGLWPGDDARDVGIDVRVARRSLVATLLRFLAAHNLRLLLLSSRPFAFALSSS